jgi:hypothetical protein
MQNNYFEKRHVLKICDGTAANRAAILFAEATTIVMVTAAGVTGWFRAIPAAMVGASAAMAPAIAGMVTIGAGVYIYTDPSRKKLTVFNDPR